MKMSDFMDFYNGNSDVFIKLTQIASCYHGPADQILAPELPFILTFWHDKSLNISFSECSDRNSDPKYNKSSESNTAMNIGEPSTLDNTLKKQFVLPVHESLLLKD